MGGVIPPVVYIPLSCLANALGVEIIANHPGISAIGDANQSKICRFTDGIEGIAYLPVTVIVSYGHAHTIYCFDNVVWEHRWKWENGQWVHY